MCIRDRYNIYPQPAIDEIIVDLKIDKKLRYIVYNIQGVQVRQGSGFSKLNIPTVDLISGIYFVKVYDEKVNKLILSEKVVVLNP